MKSVTSVLLLAIASWVSYLWITSCTTNSSIEDNGATAKKTTDSLLNLVSEPDSLTLWIKKYQKEHYLEGEMIAWRQLGRRYRERNQFVKAIDAHNKECDIAVQLADTNSIIQALNNIGTNHRRMSMLDEAGKYHYHALRLCETYSDKESYTARKNRVVSLNGIGNISLRMGDDTTADSVFRAALAGEQALQSALGQAINYANLGAIYERKGMTDSAWVYYNLSLEKNQEAQSDLGIALCYGHFGDLYMKEGDTMHAIKEYEKAYQMKDKIDTWHWLNSCLSLARVYVRQEAYTQATDLLEIALNGATEGHAMDHLADIYTLYYQIYKEQGNAGKALDAYQQSRIYHDSIANMEKVMALQNERVRYEYERRQKEIDSIQADYKKEKDIRHSLSIAMCVIILLSVIIIIQMRNSLKMKEKEKQLLKELDHVHTSFFTNITHEFRTPLTVIIGLGEKIQKHAVASNDNEYDWPSMGKMIVRQGKNMLLLINQILEIAKAKSPHAPINYKRGDIIGYLYPIIDYANELASRKEVKLVFIPQAREIEMDFVPDYLTKIMSNLISNAVKFARTNGNVCIRVYEERDWLIISVYDDGCGISAKDLPFIFNAFYQGDNGRNKGGSGVGLSLTKQLVEAMNGHIKVKSNPEKGSEFIVNLPIYQKGGEWEKNTLKADMENAFPDQEETFSNEEENENDKPRILLVEDNHDIARFIGTIVSNTNFYFARNGKEGLDKAFEIMPDIIVTDIMMPEMDGLEMCRHIRQSETLGRIPVVIISAKTSEEDRLEGLKAGADAYLCKPFSEEELNITIQSLLKRCKVMQENYVRNSMIEEGNTLMPSNQDQQFMSNVVDIIYNQMTRQRISINDIATALYITPKQLNRRINAITGENISKYILKVRMVRAKQLLDSDKNYPIAEVAQKCGYDENSNFTRAFKLYYNITPTLYKKTHMN
ncbi:MAG: response regulator [Bacteroidaceae bacterium]|nr:response regulator [Bacteroidaceae bacterium]